MIGGADVDNNKNINKNNNDDDDIHNRRPINVHCAGRRHLYRWTISDICSFAQAHCGLCIYLDTLQPYWAITGLGYTLDATLNIYR